MKNKKSTEQIKGGRRPLSFEDRLIQFNINATIKEKEDALARCEFETESDPAKRRKSLASLGRAALIEYLKNHPER